ncbi:putative bifunctional diguanylate cyclase/phosphodiesterase [Methylobacterium planeticum]|uniref:EAL domain-containing protein n=1 Tax=Methylobacterium planeticum TaxID=2615211 RepID=A0A6N6MZV7_9HYPH|nr:EAL domain-containing protein [Methylobacterium planeticum]KAB1076170.1 EAL domain-containing protein [Methylobacterium planeticum]
MIAIPKFFDMDPPRLDRERIQSAQARVIVRNAQPFYAVHACNALLMAAAYRGAAPTALVVGPLVLLLSGYLWQSRKCRRIARAPMSPEIAKRQIRSINVLAPLLVGTTSAWAFALAAEGTAALRVHSLFFMADTIIVCAVSLMHVRSASLFSLVAIPPIGILSLLTGGEDVLRITAVTFMVSGAAIFHLVRMSSKSFVDLVQQHAELKRLHEANVHLAHSDILTDLPNRAVFFARLRERIAQATVGAEVHLALIDLDGFGGVNEVLGQASGNLVLREVALRLSEHVGDRSRLGRLGGDEFGLILADGESAEDALALCREIAEALREPYHVAARSVRVSATIGLASLVTGRAATGDLKEQAYFALHQGKAGKRGGCVRFTGAFASSMRRRDGVARALRMADLQRELSVVFQPVVDASRNSIIAFEALARWTSPEIGAVLPTEFIAAAENAGLTNLLTDVLLTKALAAAATWPPEVQLFFNLSACDVATPDFAQRLSEIITASGIAPNRIAFEVTETAIIRDFPEAKKTLDALKEMGVAIALDDFGTGFSSLSYVHRLPIDKLKLDRSFIQEMETSRTCRDIVRSVIGMCRTLGIACVAEGVETREQMLLLGHLGCRTMQGYYFSNPVPQEEARLLATRDAARRIEAPGPGVASVA